MAEDQEFFVGQKAFIEKDGKLLVLLAAYGLDFPGGKIKQGETDFTAAFGREIDEEIGLKIETGEPFITWCVTIRAGHKDAGKKVFLVGYKCKYVSGEIKLSHEHVNYKWIDKDNYQEFFEDNMTYKALEKYFSERV